MENKTPNFLEKVKGFFKGLSKKQLIAIIAAIVVVAVLVPVIILLATPAKKDYTLVVVTDSAIDNKNKVSNHVLALVTDADGKIVAARLDSVEMTPALDAEGKVVAQDSVKTKVEQGDSYGGGTAEKPAMEAGSWAKQAKAFEDYIIGKTADEVANLDLSLVAGCTMQSTTPLFKALVAKAFASELKVSFSTADAITLGVAINSKVAAGRNENATVSSDFAGVVMADGKVVATMLDSCEQSFTIVEGALVAPETAAVSKNDQGDSYGGGTAEKPAMDAGSWAKQAQAFANSTVGKTVAELADLELVSDALAAAGCTMKNTTGGYKTTIIAAAGYAR